MAVSRYKIKKWFKMVKGDSILHVNQGVGKFYSKDEIKGYYNDLTEKITKDTATPDGELPKYPGEDGVVKIFPIGVFQYGLGAYDLYLDSGEKRYLEKFRLCVDWASKNQDKNGGWKTFEYETPNTPYSAMAQGEAISLLARAYVQWGDKKYLAMMERGLDFLMLSVDSGGVAQYDGGRIMLKEFVDRPVVLNGWIFSIFGIYDYLTTFPKDKKAREFYEKTLGSLTQMLPKYDLGYWSKYDLGKRIASPFYHRLHIAQLKVLYDLTGEKVFLKYAERFEKYNKKRIYKAKAFIAKVVQKVRE